MVVHALRNTINGLLIELCVFSERLDEFRRIFKTEKKQNYFTFHNGALINMKLIFLHKTPCNNLHLPAYEKRTDWYRQLRNVSPLMEVRSRRVGGANYQVPREVSQNRRLTLSFRWIINAARAKKGKPMADKLADELILAAKNEGDAIKKKDEMHRMAEANKAFAHFAW